MTKYRVIARAKDSRCPQLRVGDQMVLEGTMVNLKETPSLCAMALGAIQYSLFRMGKATDPKDFGRDDIYTLQCPDPGDEGDLRDLPKGHRRMKRGSFF